MKTVGQSYHKVLIFIYFYHEVLISISVSFLILPNKLHCFKIANQTLVKYSNRYLKLLLYI